MAQENVVVQFLIKGSKKFNSGFKNLGNVLRTVRTEIQSLIIGLVAFTAATVGVAAKVAALGGQVVQMERSFRGLASSAGESADVMLGKLKKAVDGTISDFELMRLANLAILLGLPATGDQMAELADVAQRLGRAVGRTTVQAFGDLVQGIGRQSRLILDNLGIIVQASKAYEIFAKRVGKTSSELTEGETKLAFYNEALRQARKKVEEMGAEVLESSDFVQQISAEFQNVKNELAEMIATSPAFIAALKLIRDRFKQWFDEMNKNRGAILSIINNAVTGIGKFAEILINIAPTILKLFGFLAQHADKLIRLFVAMKGALIGAAIGAGVVGLFGGGLAAVGIGAAAVGAAGAGAGFFGPELLGGRPQAAAGGGGGVININIQQNIVGDGGLAFGDRIADSTTSAINKAFFRANGGRFGSPINNFAAVGATGAVG